MELHESLYALGQSQGRALFHDADSFRGALDDWLDEDSASTGDINLLVDAVRLGAFDSLATMLDSGADPDRALTEAGSRLARDRGSADVGGAKWALAVLGYAIGKVSDVQVRSYRAEHSSGVPPLSGSPTQFPPAQPSTPSPASPIWPSSGGSVAPAPPPAPAQSPVPPVQSPPHNPGFGPPTGQVIGSIPPPPAQGGSGGVPGGPGSYGGGYAPASSGGYGQAPPKKSLLLPILIVVVALVIVGGGITGIVLFGGDDNGGGGGGGGDEGGDELEFSAIDERYGALSDSVTSGMDECTEDEVGSGEEEKLTCTGADGVTLTLTTYSSDTELAGTRTRVLDGLSEGQMSSRAESGYFYVYDPSSADNASRPNAQLYWDDMASLVSGEYRSPSDAVTYEDLITSWKATAPKVDEPPRGLEAGTPLSVFASERFGIGSCRRIPTLADGEVEELQCKRKAQSVWISYFEDKKAFNTYRNNAKTLARQDGFIVNDTWFDTADPTEAERGKIYGYNDEENNYGWLYVDDTECLCYLQAQSVDSDPYALYTDYFNITE